MIVKLFNEALRRNSKQDIELLTPIYALFYSAYAEVSFQKLINTPNGFEQSVIEEIDKQRNLEEKWSKCVEIAISNIGNSNKGEIANKKKSLKNILNEYIIHPSRIRNKIAHGQWMECLNNDCSKVNVDVTYEISSLDFVKLDRLFTIYEDFQQCIEDLIKSPKTHYRDFYLIICKIEEYIVQTKDWSVETKREQLIKSNKYKNYCRRGIS